MADVVANGSPWYYYIRTKGVDWIIGLVDRNGKAIGQASIDLKIFYDEIPLDVLDEDAIMPIQSEFELAFVKGCAAEYLSQEGVIRKDLFDAYDKAMRIAQKRVIKESLSSSVVKPIRIMP